MSATSSGDSSPNTPTTHPVTPRELGPGYYLLGGNVAGAVRNEHKSCKCRGASRGEVVDAIEAAQFYAAEDQLARRFRRVLGTHQRAADEKAIGVGRQALDIGAAGNSGLADEQATARHPAQPLSSGEVDRKVAQVAIIDPDQLRSATRGPIHLFFRVHFDEDIQTQFLLGN